MAAFDAKKERPGGLKGFFTIYKPGQGKWVRWGTVASLGIIVIFGAKTIGWGEFSLYDDLVQALVGGAVAILGALLTFWAVNSTKLAEFMIMTESEMRKVSWPNRAEVISSTKVVIVLTLLLGCLLYVVDVGFLTFFAYIGIA